ncbi:MAG: L,D-transpeptidase family protein [Gammaproteobacteria bacterium]
MQLIYISIKDQKLKLYENKRCIVAYPISSAKNGVGEREHSECTPRGWHRIAEKIGGTVPENTVFVGRVPTGEIYQPSLREQFPERDWILTRILWLDGLESNNQNTKQRYIYIHGTPNDVSMGKPGSHGCIRMQNAAMIDLFDRVNEGVRVLIG